LFNKKERSIYPKLEICFGREAATKILTTQLGRKKQSDGMWRNPTNPQRWNWIPLEEHPVNQRSWY